MTINKQMKNPLVDNIFGLQKDTENNISRAC